MAVLDGIPLATGEFEWIAPRPLKILDKRKKPILEVSFKVRGHADHYPKKIHEQITFAAFHTEEHSAIWQKLSFRRVYHTGAFIGSTNPYSLYYVCGIIDKAVLSWEQEVAYAELTVSHFATNMPSDLIDHPAVLFPFLGMEDEEKEPDQTPEEE